MCRITDLIKKSHGLRSLFCCRLRDAIFAANQNDRESFESDLKAKLQRLGFSERAIKIKISEEWSAHLQTMRRSIPEPAALEKAFTTVVHTLGCVPDEKTNEPLLSDAAWDAVDEAVQHIRLGCLSDHPSVNLYYSNPQDKTGRLYTCRGTSGLENWHLFLRSTITGNNVSPALASHLVLAKVTRWNSDMAIKHRGDIDFGTKESDMLENLKMLNEMLEIQVSR
jgi:hypothetical protein